MKKKETSTSPEPESAGSADGSVFIPQSRQEPGDTTPADKSTKVAKTAKSAKGSKPGKGAKSIPTDEALSPIEREARRILADYPARDEVHMTADGFGFFDRHDAINHTARLKDKSILTIKR